MAHPKLPHMPGVVGDFLRDVCLCLLCLAIDDVNIVYSVVREDSLLERHHHINQSRGIVVLVSVRD